MSKSFIILSLALMLSCKEETTPEELLNQMEGINAQIDALLSTSCDASSQCMVTPFGAKPCGGPTGYLVYSSNMNPLDQSRLNTLVDQYYHLNVDYNGLTGAISDCSIAPKPEVDCVSGNCQEVSN